jgi:hypothetical protein
MGLAVGLRTIAFDFWVSEPSVDLALRSRMVRLAAEIPCPAPQDAGLARGGESRDTLIKGRGGSSGRRAAARASPPVCSRLRATFLEDKQWYWDPAYAAHLIGWSGLDTGTDKSQGRSSAQYARPHPPALKSTCAARQKRKRFLRAQPKSRNRISEMARWRGRGRNCRRRPRRNDWFSYGIGLPDPGKWLQVFNSEVCDNWVNPQVAGNGGAIKASGSWSSRPRNSFRVQTGDSFCLLVLCHSQVFNIHRRLHEHSGGIAHRGSKAAKTVNCGRRSHRGSQWHC